MTFPALDAPARTLTLSGPESLAAAIPLLLGFHPRESLVLVCLRGARGRLGPMMRVDIPSRAGSPAVAEFLSSQAQRRATQAALICFSQASNERGGRFAHHDLIRLCRVAMRRAGVPLFDAMLVREDLVWSYLRHTPGQVGVSLPAADGPELIDLTAEQVLSGRSVLPGRSDVAASVAGPSPRDALAADLELTAAAGRLQTHHSELDHRGSVAFGCAAAERAMAMLSKDLQASQPLRPDICADLIVLMGEVLVRDAVISWALTRGAGSLPLLIQLARWVPDPFGAEICATLAIVAYRAGDGALANAAVDRSLICDPTHRLAGMMVPLFSAGIMPSELDRLILPRAHHPGNPDSTWWPKTHGPIQGE